MSTVDFERPETVLHAATFERRGLRHWVAICRCGWMSQLRHARGDCWADHQAHQQARVREHTAP